MRVWKLVWSQFIGRLAHSSSQTLEPYSQLSFMPEKEFGGYQNLSPRSTKLEACLLELTRGSIRSRSLMNFEECVAIIIDFEGGYVFDSNDPGGETKYGISKRQYPDIDIKDLSQEDAISIYKRDYWDRIEGDSLPDYLRLLVFDCAVNQGVSRASTFAQRSVRVEADGIIGPKTIAELYNIEPSFFVRDFSMYRFEAYAKNPGWQHFGKGWCKRLLEVILLTFAYIDHTG